MENIYFTPLKSELHIGYECEIEVPSRKMIPGLQPTWEYLRLTSIDNIKNKKLRTPYLNLDQVKKEMELVIEGFIHKLGGSYIWEREGYWRPNWHSGGTSKQRIFFDPHQTWVKLETFEIGAQEWETLFECRVRCINEFRNFLKMFEFYPE